MTAIKEVAKAFKGKITSTFMHAEENSQIAERWGASGKTFPTAVLINYEKEEPSLVTWDEEGEKHYTVDALTSFITKGLAGEYESYKKSEPIPEKNDEPVTVVVGKNFESVVNDKTKDVLIEFYAPWCGHCKKLAPIWEELGAKFAKVDSVVIAKIDATANTFPNTIDVKGFPTIFLFPAGENATPIQYDGPRELEDFVKFLQQNAATDFSLDGAVNAHEDL